MFKIEIKNKNGDRIGGDIFNTKEECEKFYSDIKATGTLGKPARWLPDFLEGADTREVPASETENVTEYLHPAEYTHEIIEETLDQIKAKKLKELSEDSLWTREAQPYGEDYRINNVALGIYDSATVEKIKAVHLKFRNNYYRLAALVNACTDESSVKAIQFTLE